METNILASQNELRTRTRQLAQSKARVRELSSQLEHVEPALADTQQALAESAAYSGWLEEQGKIKDCRLLAIRRKIQRTRQGDRAIQRHLEKLEDEDMTRLRADLQNANFQAVQTMRELDNHIRKSEDLQLAYHDALLTARKRIDALRKRCSRAPGILAKAIAAAEAKGRHSVYESVQRRIRRKGVYTPEMRAVIRDMTRSGCAPAMVGKMTQLMAGFCGANIKCNVSRRTVQRAILEGGVAAKIQLGSEILAAKGM